MTQECWKPGRVKNININKSTQPTLTRNYWSPLAGQVEVPDLDEIPPDLEIWDKNKTIRWLLPQQTRAERLHRTCYAKSKTRVEKTQQLNEIPTAVFDSGATSNCGRPGEPFIPTNERSNKIFHLPTGHTTAASVKAKLQHDVREPAQTVDIVPDLQHNSLLSASKFADAGYVTVLMETEVLIYDKEDYYKSIKTDAVLRGWRDPASGLWRVPLQDEVAPHKSKYVLLDQATEEAIANVYELPSTEQIIRYLHACAGFPTRPTWLKAIKGGNYA